MLFGIVSNCWKAQLAQGVRLESLIETARLAGYEAIELRQGHLGHYENGPNAWPDAQSLAQLPTQFPGLMFNVALSVPYFDASLTSADALFQQGIAAARALAGRFPMQLRLVDLSTTAEQLGASSTSATLARVADLAAAVSAAGGTLSLENARQPWSVFIETVRGARERLGENADALRVCFDACNLLSAADRPDPMIAVRELTPRMTSMIHFKQMRGGANQPVVTEGDVDWAAQLRHWRSVKYAGPALFEIAPHEAVWRNFEDSRAYLSTQ